MNQEVLYDSGTASVNLTCEVECGNPATYTYSWFDSADQLLSKSNSSNNYTYTIKNTIDNIYCLVENSVSYGNYRNESITRFVVQDRAGIIIYF